MEFAAGALRPLIEKLGALLLEKYNLNNKLKKDVSYLATELTMMHAALRKVGDIPRDKLDDQVRIWAGKVRELSYKMEDEVDAFIVRAEEDNHDGEPPTIKKWLMKVYKKSGRLFRWGRGLQQISDAIEETKDLAKQLGELRHRYGLDMHDVSVGVAIGVAIDPRLIAMYRDVKELVGIEDTRDEVVKMLIGGEEWKKQQMKTVSIVGFGGLGKTTLAKAVYEKIKDQFDCGAFVSVSQSPDIKRIFKDMLYELDKIKYKEIHRTARDEKQIIDELGEFLRNKRYLIIIDDIWDEQVWRFIRCPLAQSSQGSRIITTTRKISVSETCRYSSEDIIYRIKPLSGDDSRRLFYRRIFQSDNGCPHELEQVSKDILRKCGGVPLAIITIASFLASNKHIKPKQQWYHLLNSIGRGLEEDANLEEMKRILSFSYYDLPSHLKTCLLYLSIFPEDSRIYRDELIWKWIAEGFVHSSRQETSLFEVGESYYNELINRSLIQPLDVDPEVGKHACRVHDMVVDLICSLASEENFVTVLDGTKSGTPELSLNKGRRLSLQNGMGEATTSLQAMKSMSHVRSLITVGFGNFVASLSTFGVLRVLDLQCCGMPENWFQVNLKSLGTLLHLRYLSLKGTSVKEIPMEIGKLKYLQMLNLFECEIDELPSNVCRLKQLLCLRIEPRVKMPVGMDKLVSLEEMSGLRVYNDDPNKFEELGHLKALRALCIHWGEIDDRLEKELVKSLGNLCKLQTLRIEARDLDHDCYELIRLQGWVPPPNLSKLVVACGLFSTLPAWINPWSLPFLSVLEIDVSEVWQADIEMIGMLPALRFLRLLSYLDYAIPVDGFLVSADAFPCLKDCVFVGLQILPCMIPRGAMRMVQCIKYQLHASAFVDGIIDLDMRNLPSLERVEVVVWRRRGISGDSEGELAEAALRFAADAHPNRPALTINSYPYAYSSEEGDDDMEEEEDAVGEMEE